MEELNQFKDFLIDLLTTAREDDKKAKGRAKTWIEANMWLLGREIMFLNDTIKKGELDMDKAKAEIKVLDEGTFEAIGRSSREKSPLTVQIIEIANKLKARGYAEIDPRGIEPSKVMQKVYNLSGKSIPTDVLPTKKIIVDGEIKEGLFLIKLTKEQMQARPKRTRTTKTNGN
jgi:hypothetical protein